MGNTQKTPLARAQWLFAQQKALREIEKRGYALPGHVLSVSGSIVTVAFDVTDAVLPQVTMPVFGPEYIRYPIQAGDKGVAFPATVSLTGVSGLGQSSAPPPILPLPGNLSTLVWFPVANKNWSTPPGSNANTLALYGKLALLLLDSLAGHSSVSLTSTGIVLTFGSVTATLNASGISLKVGSTEAITITSSGITIGPATTLDSRLFLAHTHSGVSTGSGVTGPVV